MSLWRRTTCNGRVNTETPEPAWQTSESSWRKSYWSWGLRKMSKEGRNQTIQPQEQTVLRSHRLGGWETGRPALLRGGRHGSRRARGLRGGLAPGHSRRPALGTQTTSPPQHSSGWDGRTATETDHPTNPSWGPRGPSGAPGEAGERGGSWGMLSSPQAGQDWTSDHHLSSRCCLTAHRERAVAQNIPRNKVSSWLTYVMYGWASGALKAGEFSRVPLTVKSVTAIWDATCTRQPRPPSNITSLIPSSNLMEEFLDKKIENQKDWAKVTQTSKRKRLTSVQAGMSPKLKLFLHQKRTPHWTPRAKRTPQPFDFGAESLLPLQHGDDELSPLLFYVVWVIALKEFDASKLYPNLEKTAQKVDVKQRH